MLSLQLIEKILSYFYILLICICYVYIKLIFMDKTNVMRILQQKKIEFKEYFYWDTNATNWVEIAKILGEDENIVFKTLVTIWKSWQHYVFMVPVAQELDLKKCAKIVDEKYKFVKYLYKLFYK